MALPARNYRRVVLCHWHDPFFWQSLPAEFEWYKVVRCDHAAWRVGIFGWLGMPSVGCVESASETELMNLCNWGRTAVTGYTEYFLKKGSIREVSGGYELRKQASSYLVDFDH
jgi:hypothetical protein